MNALVEAFGEMIAIMVFHEFLVHHNLNCGK